MTVIYSGSSAAAFASASGDDTSTLTGSRAAAFADFHWLSVRIGQQAFRYSLTFSIFNLVFSAKSI
jgi:hypothetical protein